MDELVTGPGADEGLSWSLRFEEAPAGGTAADVTRGQLRVAVRGMPVWSSGAPGQGVTWTWVEMLEFLGRAWRWLAWEDGLPLGLRPADPAQVRAEAESRWQEMAAHRREEEERQLESFEDTHDLARSVQGAVLPSVWVFREGHDAWVCGGGRAVRRPAQEVLGSLAQLGDCLTTRLAEVPDPRATAAVETWRTRAEVDLQARVSVMTGLSPEELLALQGGDSPELVWEAAPGQEDPTELVAAARMAGGRSTALVRAVVESVRGVPRGHTPALDALAERVRGEALGGDGRPWDQGYAAAGWLRAQPGVASPHGPVDPERLLRGWGVEVRELDLPDPGVDAVACWGPRHGPCVLVNPGGRHHQRSRAGRRATLAHEVAHLLLDRRGALPVAEVLGGRLSPHVEARARAFAAELLLPRAVAGAAMAAAARPEVEARRLTRVHGVSMEVVAWQARNSHMALPGAVDAFLRRWVSRPAAY
jgi:Zn-dependent peptidase ImmA (M78 family)